MSSETFSLQIGMAREHLTRVNIHLLHQEQDDQIAEETQRLFEEGSHRMSGLGCDPLCRDICSACSSRILPPCE
jgi:hypothetical protein